MLHFSWSIQNPFANSDYSRIYDNWNKVSENKTLEFSLMRCNTILGFGLDVTHRQNHAGVYTDISCLGYSASVNFYDKRHWDTDANSWQK